MIPSSTIGQLFNKGDISVLAPLMKRPSSNIRMLLIVTSLVTIVLSAVVRNSLFSKI